MASLMIVIQEAIIFLPGLMIPEVKLELDLAEFPGAVLVFHHTRKPEWQHETDSIHPDGANCRKPCGAARGGNMGVLHQKAAISPTAPILFNELYCAVGSGSDFQGHRSKDENIV